MNNSGDIATTALLAAGPAAIPVILTFVELVFLVVMIGVTLAWLAGSRLSLFHRHLVERRYGIYVMEATVERLGDDSPIFGASILSKGQLKTIILGRMLRSGGKARSGLADLYKRMGFLEKDAAAMSSARWRKRVGACTAVAVAGDETSVAGLTRLLKDPGEAVRIAASRALLRLGAAGEAPSMLAAMEDSTDWCSGIIGDSVAAMGPAAFGAVKAALEGSPSPRLRAGLVELLGKLRDPKCIPLLLHCLQGDDVEVRIRSARGLGAVKDIRAATALERALSDGSWEVRAQAAKSLGKVGDGACSRCLGRCLDDKNWWVRYNGAHALAALGEEGVGELERISKEGEGFARDIARQALGMTEKEAVEE